MFYCLSAVALYEGLGSPSRASPLATAFAQYLLAASIALWVLSDARRRGCSPAYDFDSLVFFTWPVLAPIYLFSTRGWRGVIPIGGFTLLYLSAAILGNIARILTLRH